MIRIKTSLNCSATAFNGAFRIDEYADPFSGIDTLALVIGMADQETRQLPTDLDGLKTVVWRLNSLQEDCLFGLQGIGAVLSTAQLEGMPEEGLGSLGRLIGNLAALAVKANDYREIVTKDPRFPLLRT